MRKITYYLGKIIQIITGFPLEKMEARKNVK